MSRDESRQPSLLVLDLSGLTFIDSTGIGLLVETRAWALEDGLELVLMRGTGQVQRALELAGVDREVRIVDDESEVVGSAPGGAWRSASHRRTRTRTDLLVTRRCCGLRSTALSL